MLRTGRWRYLRTARVMLQLPTYVRLVWGLARDVRTPVGLKLLLGAALALTVLWLVHRLPEVWSFLRWLALIPIGFAVADVVENILLLIALRSFPDAAPSWAATVTSVKLTLGLSAIPIVAVLGVMCLLLRGGRGQAAGREERRERKEERR